MNCSTPPPALPNSAEKFEVTRANSCNGSGKGQNARIAATRGGRAESVNLDFLERVWPSIDMRVKGISGGARSQEDKAFGGAVSSIGA